MDRAALEGRSARPDGENAVGVVPPPPSLDQVLARVEIRRSAKDDGPDIGPLDQAAADLEVPFARPDVDRLLGAGPDGDPLAAAIRRQSREPAPELLPVGGPQSEIHSPKSR